MTLSSCSKKREEGVLEYAVHRVRSLDWSLLAANHGLTNHLIEPVIAYKLNKNKFELDPRLFSRWTRNETGTVWTFDIRKNVLWTDGKELDADDFINSIQRILQPETGIRKAEKLFIIKGAENYYRKTAPFDKVGIKSLSKLKLQITLDRGTDLILHMFTENFLSPVRTDLIKKNPEEWLEPENLVTLGPFKLKQHRFGELLEFEANENYYRGVPKLKKIRVRVIESEKTAIRLFKQKKIDLVQVRKYANVTEFKAKKEIHFFPSVDTATLSFKENARKVYPNNFRKYIYENIFLDNTPSPQNLGISPFPNNQSLLTRKKKSVIKQTEFAELHKLLPLKLFVPPSMIEHAEQMHFKIKEKTGINLDIERGSLLNVEEGRIGAYLSSTGPYNLHPVSFYHDFSGAIGEKIFGWKNPQFEKLFEKFKFQVDPEKRKSIQMKMDKIIRENYLMVPLFQWVKIYLVSEKLKGVKMSYPYRMDLSEAYFKK